VKLPSLEDVAWWAAVVFIGIPLTALDAAADWLLGYRDGKSRHDQHGDAKGASKARRAQAGATKP
jgi:hypothetical protein